MMGFEAEHNRRMLGSIALTAELLPSKEDEVGEIRAEVREQHRRVGTGEDPREVEDPYAFEREHNARFQSPR